jgi:RNA polymerase sigma-54 factor
MKTSLHLKLSQHLTLTPQLQQSIKLLQLSTVELNQELERFLLENPLLERDDIPGENGAVMPFEANGEARTNGEDRASDVNGSESASEPAETRNDTADFNVEDGLGFGSNTDGVRRTSDDGDDEGTYGEIAAPQPSLSEHLLGQFALMSLSERDKALATILVAHLDEDGYLTHTLDEMLELIGEHMDDVEIDDLQVALKLVQNLEPIGVGARSLSECLQLQLLAMDAATPFRNEAITLVASHLDVLAQRDFVKLKRALRVDDEELKAIRELVVSLNPKPGHGFGMEDTRYVVPDVVVKKVAGKWQAFLNQEAMPKLRVNKLYADLLHKSRDANGKNLAGQLQEARWLIKNVQQRFDTILRVTQAIVERQKHFFEHGEVAMRPLVLREIADQVGLHESTISRVTTQKYMLTPRGIYELKYFFGSSVATDSGGACSATAIRALIKQLVSAEDQRKPLSDNRISDILAEQGIIVARRTVAKYREGMHIQPANLRKSL